MTQVHEAFIVTELLNISWAGALVLITNGIIQNTAAFRTQLFKRTSTYDKEVILVIFFSYFENVLWNTFVCKSFSNKSANENMIGSFMTDMIWGTCYDNLLNDISEIH